VREVATPGLPQRLRESGERTACAQLAFRRLAPREPLGVLNLGFPRGTIVGVTWIEPVTPTMSTQGPIGKPASSGPFHAISRLSATFRDPPGGRGGYPAYDLRAGLAIGGRRFQARRGTEENA
jgi:hypothetical protein